MLDQSASPRLFPHWVIRCISACVYAALKVPFLLLKSYTSALPLHFSVKDSKDHISFPFWNVHKTGSGSCIHHILFKRWISASFSSSFSDFSNGWYLSFCFQIPDNPRGFLPHAALFLPSSVMDLLFTCVRSTFSLIFSLGKLINFLPRTVPSPHNDNCIYQISVNSFTGVFVMLLPPHTFFSLRSASFPLSDIPYLMYKPVPGGIFSIFTTSHATACFYQFFSPASFHLDLLSPFFFLYFKLFYS